MTHSPQTDRAPANAARNLPALAPEALPPAPQQFSREDQAFFLDCLAQCGNVLASARKTGVSRSTVYRMRRACPRFSNLWDAALLLARPLVEAVLADRALNGVEETIYYHGEAVATRTRYDARLLLAHLGRLDRLARDYAASDAAAEFEIGLDELCGEKEITFVPYAPVQGPGRAADTAGDAGERPDTLPDETEEERDGFPPLDTVSGVSGQEAPQW